MGVAFIGGVEEVRRAAVVILIRGGLSGDCGAPLDETLRDPSPERPWPFINCVAASPALACRRRPCALREHGLLPSPLKWRWRWGFRILT